MSQKVTISFEITYPVTTEISVEQHKFPQQQLQSHQPQPWLHADNKNRMTSLLRRPTLGRPKPLRLSSVILLLPEDDAKLTGTPSYKELLREAGYGGLVKTLDRIEGGKQKTVSSVTVANCRRLLAAAAKNTPNEPLIKLFDDALAGSETAQEILNNMGAWELYRIGQSLIPGSTPTHMIPLDHCVDVEQASATCLRSIRCGNYQEAANVFAAHPYLRPYMTEAALEHFYNATSELSTMVSRTAGLLEFMLSQTARMDVMTWRIRGGRAGIDELDKLLKRNKNHQLNPGSQLISRLMKHVEVSSQKKLLSLAQGAKTSMTDDSSLKRWSRGNEFPSEQKYWEFSTAALKNANLKCDQEAMLWKCGTEAWAARQFHKSLEIARQIYCRSEAIGQHELWKIILGATNPEDWCEARFSYWRQHWEAHTSIQKL